jgi:hypothetical protein
MGSFHSRLEITVYDEVDKIVYSGFVYGIEDANLLEGSKRMEDLLKKYRGVRYTALEVNHDLPERTTPIVFSTELKERFV